MSKSQEHMIAILCLLSAFAYCLSFIEFAASVGREHVSIVEQIRQ